MSLSADDLKVQIIKKAWEDPQFKEQLLKDPKGAIQEAFGIELPADIELKVVEEAPESYYMVLPAKPEETLAAEKVEAEPFIWT
ncbi:putative ribosomally synthesized peptide [Paenibacillus cellulosilyticus]|uniref:Putative ribosomally synthesized peptide n=1 Tax=Paenibacillus cellulosilyticus TaxID=375489 RepID=A0A2V2YZ74_9BACL|nr:NHLP leader peptide family RiPP precursor [Paenibacillus cellulosilyticus]PWW05164.1 putative ribosomally synthesized peptide [Paenibacillus cellulosilyticus]QKS48703.1 NHLP leader peptide family natural product precursor [Paenibacillus cellulosilyticus]